MLSLALKTPADDIADAERGMSELWARRTLAYLEAMAEAQGGGGGQGQAGAWPVVTPDENGLYTI